MLYEVITEGELHGRGAGRQVASGDVRGVDGRHAGRKEIDVAGGCSRETDDAFDDLAFRPGCIGEGGVVQQRFGAAR